MILILLGVLSGCRPNEAVCGSQIADAGVYENVCGFGVPEDARQAALYMQVQLRRGRMSWDLEDPQGNVVWSGFADSSGPVDKSARIDQPAPGRWNLRIHVDGAVGEYSAPWLVKE